MKLLAIILLFLSPLVQAQEPVKGDSTLHQIPKNPNKLEYAASLINLAGEQEDKGQYAKAESLYLEALAITKEVLGEEHRYYATSLKNLATLYNRQGQYAKAELFIMEALSIIKEVHGEMHPYYVDLIFNLAQVYHQMGLNTESYSLFLWTKKYYLEYLENMFDFMGELDRDQFYTKMLNYFEVFQNFAIEESSRSPEILGELYNLQLTTKSILLNTSNQIKRRILQSDDRVLVDLYDEVQTLKQEIGRNQNFKDSLSELLSEKDRELSEYASYYAEEQIQYTWQDVQTTLGRGEAAIEIIRLKKWNFQTRKSTDTVLYAALIVTRKTNKYPELVLFNEGNELEGRYLQYYRNTTRLQKEDTLSYYQYWKPLTKDSVYVKYRFFKKTTRDPNYLQYGYKSSYRGSYIQVNHLRGIKTVYFSPDGVYNSINLQTLYNPEKKKFLNEEIDVNIVTSTKDLLTTKSDPMRFNYAVLVGNPDFGEESITIDSRGVALTMDSLEHSGISSLPGTQIEIDELSELFQDKGWQIAAWTQQEATEGKIKNMHKPKVLHIATHGFFEPDIDDHSYRNNPLHRSGLLLSGAEKVFQKDGTYIQSGEEDGILTAFEAMNLNIENTELVVLSACETGLGEIRNGEGVYGLQRALKVAGARSILISLWKVSDQVTQELMVDFYTNWLGGMSKREALKQTQLKLKEKYKSPFYWGAFVLIGE